VTVGYTWLCLCLLKPLMSLTLVALVNDKRLNDKLGNAQTFICQLITIGDRFSSFSEPEAYFRVRVKVKLGFGLVPANHL